jgi:CubicO group peptidase (beta-lactamase class C family)
MRCTAQAHCWAWLATFLLLTEAQALPLCPPEPAVGPELAVTAQASALPALEAEFVPRLQKLIRGRKVPGIAVAVIESGQVSWARSFGFADTARRMPFEIDTPIPLGRWSELPLHLLAVELAQRGRIDLDAAHTMPAGLRWPGAAEPTLRQLLSHHSGLNGGRLQGLYADPKQPWSGPESERYAARAPGLLESYSLVGLDLATTTLEEALRDETRTLEQVLLEQLQGLYGIDCARPSLSYEVPAELARGHRDREQLPLMVASKRVALGLHGSLRGAIALFTPLTQMPLDPSWQAIVEVQNGGAVFDFDRKLGLGVDLLDSQRAAVGRVALAFGAAPGYRAEARVALQHRLAVIVLANGNDEELLGDIPGDLLDAVLQARLGIPRRERETPLPERVEYPAGLTAVAFADRYATPFGRLRVEERFEGGFDFELFGRGFRAQQREDGWYRLSYRLLGLIPLRFSIINQTLLGSARHGEHELLLAHVFGRTLLLGSTPFGASVPSDFDRWLGSYRLANPDLLTRSLKVDRIELLREGTDLVLEYRLPTPFLLTFKPRVLLEAADAEHLRVAGLGPLLGEQLRVRQSDGKASLSYAGYVFERE